MNNTWRLAEDTIQAYQVRMHHWEVPSIEYTIYLNEMKEYQKQKQKKNTTGLFSISNQKLQVHMWPQTNYLYFFYLFSFFFIL